MMDKKIKVPYNPIVEDSWIDINPMFPIITDPGDEGEHISDMADMPELLPEFYKGVDCTPLTNAINLPKLRP